MTSLLARARFKVGRDLGPPQLLEASGGAPEISRCVDGRVIGPDQRDDIAGKRELRAREALFNSGKSEIYRAVEEPDRAALRTDARHRPREWIDVLFRAAQAVKPNLSRLSAVTERSPVTLTHSVTNPAIRNLPLQNALPATFLGGCRGRRPNSL